MSKKNKHKKKKKKGFFASSYTPCEHPLYVKVGNHKVVCLGYNDFEPFEHTEILQGLDVFIGLSLGWEKHEATKKQFLSPLIQKIYEKYLKVTFLENIIYLPIEDREINLEVFKIAKNLLEENKKIGFGCMAGHGRTGWLLSKLIQYFEKCSGDKAVERCRKRFCKKCVESKVQVDDLGCVLIEARDVAYSWHSTWGIQPTPNFPSTEELEKSIVEKEETMPDTSADIPFTNDVIEVDDELRAIYRKEQEGEELTPKEQKRLDEDIALLIAYDMKKEEDD